MTSKELKNKVIIITSLDEVAGTINSIFGYVAGTSSVRFKNSFLQEHMNPTIEQILQDTYGGRKYFVKKYEVLGTGPLTIDHDYEFFHDMLDSLAERKVTGNAAVQLVQDTIERFCAHDQVWLARILDGNLKIGAGNTFAKDSGTIDKYPCALANVLEKVNTVDVFDGTWLASRKLDGCRCHAHIDLAVGTVTFKSRQGKEFATLDNLKQPVLDFLRNNPNLDQTGRWVLDGEVCIMDGENEDFQGLMSVIRRKDFTIENPKYKVFDMLTEDEFWGRAESPNFSIRYNLLRECSAVPHSPKVEVLFQERITGPNVLDEWQAKRKEGDWEGIMVRRDVPYEGKRSNNLLKIKPFQREEYIVTGIIEGDMSYNTPTGSEVVHGVSALTIEHKGNVVKVGSGLTREQREAWIADPNTIIGKTIAVQFFSETQDKKTGEYSLRFPTLIYVYEDGRHV